MYASQPTPERVTLCKKSQKGKLIMAKRLQLNGTNMERIQQILTEADKVKEELTALKRSNLGRELKQTLIKEKEDYLNVLRTQYQNVKEAINKQLKEQQEKEKAEEEAKRKQQIEKEARQLSLYKLSTVLPEGMYEELPSEHKAIVSPYTRKDGSICYSIDPSKLTGIITVAGNDYTCKELYEFLVAKHPLFSYTNWCYIAPEYKISIYKAFKSLIEETLLLEDIRIYRSLHTRVED